MTTVNNKCPLCGDERSYKSFFAVECPNPDCENYSISQQELVKELEDSIVEENPIDEEDFSTVPLWGVAYNTTIPCNGVTSKGGINIPDTTSTIPYPKNSSSDSDSGWLIPPIT